MKKLKIAVIGAGIAGLETARKLQNRKFNSIDTEVVLYEASDCVGGRIHTIDLGDGYYAEAGMLALTDKDTLTLKLAAETSIELINQFNNKNFCHTESEISYLFEKYVLTPANNLEINEAKDWFSKESLELDKINFRDYLRKNYEKKDEIKISFK